jgi:hypothetical protein
MVVGSVIELYQCNTHPLDPRLSYIFTWWRAWPSSRVNLMASWAIDLCQTNGRLGHWVVPTRWPAPLSLLANNPTPHTPPWKNNDHLISSDLWLVSESDPLSIQRINVWTPCSTQRHHGNWAEPQSELHQSRNQCHAMSLDIKWDNCFSRCKHTEIWLDCYEYARWLVIYCIGGKNDYNKGCGDKIWNGPPLNVSSSDTRVAQENKIPICTDTITHRRPQRTSEMQI